MLDLSAVMNQLEKWRYLPSYALERRVDILFGMCLPNVIEYWFGVKDAKVIPEFPLHKDSLGIEKNNQSLKVDFAVFAHKNGRERLFLVELKTDMDSRNSNQLDNMKIAKSAGSKKLLEGVILAAQSTRVPRKYAHLIWQLNKFKCLESCNHQEFVAMCLKDARPGLVPAFRKVHVASTWSNAQIELVLVLPQKDSKVEEYSVITSKTLCQFADALEATFKPTVPKEVGEFTTHVREWVNVKAGEKTPWLTL